MVAYMENPQLDSAKLDRIRDIAYAYEDTERDCGGQSDN